MTDGSWGDVGQIPEGVDIPEDERDVSDADRALGQAARDARQALTTFADQPDRAAAVREYVRRFQVAWNAAHQTPRLTVDGTYGTNTRRSLAHALGETEATMPPVRTSPAPRTPARPARSTPTRTPTPTPTPTTDANPPVWLPTAVALARWTESARAADSTANTKLRALRQNAAWLASRTTAAMGGIEVGRMPSAPAESDVAAWTRTVWERAQREGTAAQRELARRSEGLIAGAERALADARRWLERETRAATSDAETAAVRLLEETLTAILRPLSRGVATAVRPIGTGLVIVGVVVLGGYLLAGRKAA